jgi:hypothetical protein
MNYVPQCYDVITSFGHIYYQQHLAGVRMHSAIRIYHLETSLMDQYLSGRIIIRCTTT